ncbi:MAG TPA: SPFH domain-containing protein [Methylocystis sp.]|nr:SPFH domain-containing protein [Methylocystis sp.]
MPAQASPVFERATVADKRLRAVNGYLMLALGLVLLGTSVWWGVSGFDPLARAKIAVGGIGVLAAWIWLMGLVVLQPNQSLVCLLFGSYVGTKHEAGLWWVNPFNSKKKVSRRLETLESGPLKVNDAVGNPVDIGAVIVWRVEDAAKATLEVHDYQSYVKAQSETALRRLASSHPYDQVEVEEAIQQGAAPLAADLLATKLSLRDGGDAISSNLLAELRSRMQPIGIAVIEARISHLAYASEIAGAMLRKQAAGAVVAARRLVVKGAVSIVENALAELDRKEALGFKLDPEKRAAIVANLLVVLVSDREAAPVINTGSL